MPYRRRLSFQHLRARRPSQEHSECPYDGNRAFGFDAVYASWWLNRSGFPESSRARTRLARDSTGLSEVQR